jgi:hypothetical protein
MSVLPSKRDAILLVDANAVTTGPAALQQLKPVAGWNHEIIEATGGVEQFQFALDDPPQLARNPPSHTRVPFAKQASRRLIAEGLNHGRVTYYTGSM